MIEDYDAAVVARVQREYEEAQRSLEAVQGSYETAAGHAGLTAVVNDTEEPEQVEP